MRKGRWGGEALAYPRPAPEGGFNLAVIAAPRRGCRIARKAESPLPISAISLSADAGERGSSKHAGLAREYANFGSSCLRWMLHLSACRTFLASSSRHGPHRGSVAFRRALLGLHAQRATRGRCAALPRKPRRAIRAGRLPKRRQADVLGKAADPAGPSPRARARNSAVAFRR